MAIVDFIFANGWITIRCDPDACVKMTKKFLICTHFCLISLILTCKIIGMYSIFDELAQSILVHINATGLTMMNVAFDHGWIGAGFHLETSYTIVVNIVFLEISLFMTNSNTIG